MSVCVLHALQQLLPLHPLWCPCSWVACSEASWTSRASWQRRTLACMCRATPWAGALARAGQQRHWRSPVWLSQGRVEVDCGTH